MTKQRNRLLLSTAELCLEDDKIRMQHIENLITNDSYTRLDHCLTKSDINLRDRQNYKSCIRLLSDEVMNLVNKHSDTHGTIVYLMLLKMIVKVYVNKFTPIDEREFIFVLYQQNNSELIDFKPFFFDQGFVSSVELVT